MADAQRLGAGAEQLAVQPHALGVDRAHGEHLLGLGVVGIEIAGPVDAMLGDPAREHRLRGPKAGPGVDHRGAADRAADRGRDRRAPGRDGEPAVAIQGGERRERLGGVGAAVHVRPRLEHDDLESGLCEHRRGHGAAGT